MAQIQIDKKKFWQLHNSLLKGVFYKDIVEYKTFYHYRSVFREKFYNFIKPKVGLDKLNWNEAETVIKTEAKDGYELSYFINEEFNDLYKEILLAKEFIEVTSDYYPIRAIESEFTNLSKDFSVVAENNFEEYYNIVKACFPNYPNNRKYCEFSFKKQIKNPQNFINVLLRVNNKFVTFGSICMSAKLGVAFLHNMATLEDFRRKGNFSLLTKYLCNLAYGNSIKYVYANVEYGEGSYFGFQKLGFEIIDKNYIYSKK